MKMLKVISHLDNVIDKHFDMSYTPAENRDDDNNGSLFTPSICTIELQHITNDGVIKKSGIMSITGKMAKLVYSAFIGWREERRQHVMKTTLDMNELYEDLLLEHGSCREVEVKDDDKVRALGYRFQFIEGVAFVRNNEDVPNTSDNDTWMVERVPYFHERIYTDGGEIPDQITQTVALPEEIWWKCHLGLISIHDNWDELYEKYSLSEENKESLIDEFIKLNS